MHPPSFRFEWNLNTVAIIVAFMGGLIAWGYAIQGWNDTKSDLVHAQAEINNLKNRLEIVNELVYRLTSNESTDKARDERLDRMSEVITLFRDSFAQVNTKLEVLSSKVDIVGESVKEQRKQQGITR